MARAATAGELTKFRAGGQFSRLYLAVHVPATVFACRVNQTFETTDMIAAVTYDTVTAGAFADVLPGMTVYVGTSAGAYDLGMCRVRAAATATVLYLGEASEIAWDDNLYLTVVDEFGLWAKHLTLTGTTPQMDYDVAYTDQHDAMNPVPVLGPDAVLWLTGATVVFSPTAAASWVLGSTITAYAWTAPGASATANLNTATPTITYNAAGTYRVACTVTAANGKTATGYRVVFVYTAASMPATCQLVSCSGEAQSGGWSFTVDLHDAATLSAIRDRAKVLLFARDWYNGVEGSIGPVAGYENVIASGWIDGESIEQAPDQGSVRFTAHGPAWWLANISGFPTGLKNDDAAPDSWLFIEGLTVDKALWHLLEWRSTATAIMDCYLSGDTRLLPATEAGAGSLWQQLDALAYQTIQARPLCDRYGRLYVEVDTQILAPGDRVALPVVMEITKPDWMDAVAIERRTVGTVGLLEISGVSYDGATATPIISRAPGHIPRRHGRIEARERLLFADQTDANDTAGRMLAQLNNPYPSVALSLAANNRLVDIAPRQYVTLTLAAGDTERGITWTAQALIPRRVEYRHEAGALLTAIECEAETDGSGQPGGVTIIPATPGIPNIPTYPTLPIPTIPRSPFGSITIPTNPPDWYTPPPDTGVDPSCPTSAGANGPYTVLNGLSLDNAGEGTYLAVFPCTVRSATHDNITTLMMNGRFYTRPTGTGNWTETDAYDFFNIYAYGGAGDLFAMDKTLPVTNRYHREGTFGPPAATHITGLRVAMSWPTSYPATGANKKKNLWWVAFPGHSTGTLTWSAYRGGIYCKWTGLTLYQHATFPYTNDFTAEHRIEMVADGVPTNQWYHWTTRFTLREGELDFVDGPIKTSLSFLESEAYPPIWKEIGSQTDEDLIFGPNSQPTAPNEVYAKVETFWKGSTVPAGQIVAQFDWEVWLWPTATRRMDLDNMLIYNICP